MDCSPLSSFTVPLSVRETAIASTTGRNSRTSCRATLGEEVLPLCKMVCGKGGECLSPSSSTEPLGEVGLAFPVQLHFPGLSFHQATGNNPPSPSTQRQHILSAGMRDRPAPLPQHKNDIFECTLSLSEWPKTHGQS